MIDLDMMQAFKAKIEKQDQFFRSLIACSDTDAGLDPSPVEIFPYQSRAAAGQTLQFELRARNHGKTPVEWKAAMVLPAGWRSDPSVVQLQAGPGGWARAPIAVTISPDFRAKTSRVAIAADVIASGVYLGQVAEAVIDVQSL
jgi:hypothetical protein